MPVSILVLHRFKEIEFGARGRAKIADRENADASNEVVGKNGNLPYILTV